MVTRSAISDESSASAASSWTPGTATDHHAIRQQLERILEHSFFKNSKRYPNLLRYIVEHSLRGETHLKERVLGVEVFGRDPSYDTNDDPVVRIAAGEVRKRIAQYYHESGHAAELRIDLPPGSYTPIYRLPSEGLGPELPASAAPTSTASAIAVPPILKRPMIYAYIGLAVVLLTAVIGFVKASVPKDPLQDLWGPILSSNGPLLLCLGEPTSATPPPANSASSFLNPGSYVTFPEASAAFRVGKFLTLHGMTTHLRPANAVPLADLRQFPSVLVGGLDNSWTLRIVEPLRFHFVTQLGQASAMIEDRSNPSKKDWSIDLDHKDAQLTRDYAIIARFSDATTAQPVVVAGGLGENGTLAAAQFLAEAKFAKDLAGVSPKGWEKKNLELVITTQIVDGQAGPPRILATYFW